MATILHSDAQKHRHSQHSGPHNGASLGILGQGDASGSAFITGASVDQEGPRLLRAPDRNFVLDKLDKRKKGQTEQQIQTQQQQTRSQLLAHVVSTGGAASHSGGGGSQTLHGFLTPLPLGKGA